MLILTRSKNYVVLREIYLTFQRNTLPIPVMTEPALLKFKRCLECPARHRLIKYFHLFCSQVCKKTWPWRLFSAIGYFLLRCAIIRSHSSIMYTTYYGLSRFWEPHYMTSPCFIKNLVVDRRLMLGSGTFNKSHQGLSPGRQLWYVIYICIKSLLICFNTGDLSTLTQQRVSGFRSGEIINH